MIISIAGTCCTMKELMDQGISVVARLVGSIFIDPNGEGRITDDGMCPADSTVTSTLFGCHTPGSKGSLILSLSKNTQEIIAVWISDLS